MFPHLAPVCLRGLLPLSPSDMKRDFYTRRLGWEGYSSHSGRRTFATQAARKVSAAGGSLRDVQQLLGHASMATTEKSIEGSTDAKRRLVDMI